MLKSDRHLIQQEDEWDKKLAKVSNSPVDYFCIAFPGNKV